MNSPSRIRHALRALSPAIGSGSFGEALRAGGGALVGLAVAGLAVAGLALLSPQIDTTLGLYLIAPFGATSVLLFAVPNSPLAQPWSAVVGNMASAVVAVAVCLLVADPVWRVALAVGLAIVAMILLRAVHPPGGAVAMTAAMNPDAIGDLGFGFALAPVGAGTIVLMLVAVAYANATGRRYPFRQFDEPGSHGTADPAPPERLGLSEADLGDILSRYHQSLNLGVEDLARLIGAAELQAAGRRVRPALVADIMSRDLVTVKPATRLGQVAEIFRTHAFTALPVVGPGDRFVGVIFQIHLIRTAQQVARHGTGGFRAAMTRLLARRSDEDISGRDVHDGGDGRGHARLRAGDIMDARVPIVRPDAPLASLLPMLAEGACDAVPVLDQGRLVGIVTRTDLIAALAREGLRASA